MSAADSISQLSTFNHLLNAGVAGAQLALIRPTSPDRYRDLRLAISDQHRGWASAHRGLISLDGQVRLLDPLLSQHGRVRNQAKRRGREPRDFVGSTPTSVTLS